MYNDGFRDRVGECEVKLLEAGGWVEVSGRVWWKIWTSSTPLWRRKASHFRMGLRRKWRHEHRNPFVHSRAIYLASTQHAGPCTRCWPCSGKQGLGWGGGEASFAWSSQANEEFRQANGWFRQHPVGQVQHSGDTEAGLLTWSREDF